VSERPRPSHKTGRRPCHLRPTATGLLTTCRRTSLVKAVIYVLPLDCWGEILSFLHPTDRRTPAALGHTSSQLYHIVNSDSVCRARFLAGLVIASRLASVGSDDLAQLRALQQRLRAARRGDPEVQHADAAAASASADIPSVDRIQINPSPSAYGGYPAQELVKPHPGAEVDCPPSCAPWARPWSWKWRHFVLWLTRHCVLCVKPCSAPSMRPDSGLELHRDGPVPGLWLCRRCGTRTYVAVPIRNLHATLARQPGTVAVVAKKQFRGMALVVCHKLHDVPDPLGVFNMPLADCSVAPRACSVAPRA
jgi:hypothetical protein